MKYGNSFYLQLSRELFSDQYKELSVGAKWLFVVLNELEQRYTGSDQKFFYRRNAELAEDAGISLSSLKRYKEELQRAGLIQTWNAHFREGEASLSTEKISCYRLLI